MRRRSRSVERSSRCSTVHVTAVNTMNMLGKERRVGRHIGRRPSWKKAIVTLAEGEMIDVFGGE